MTVIDTSGLVDFLLGVGAVDEVGSLFESEEELAAPDVVVFEVLAVLRRLHLGGSVTLDRAAGAVDDLGDLRLSLFESLTLRARAWALRDNMTVADALFVSLAEQLSEPLATKDSSLASAVSLRDDVDVQVIRL